MQAKLERICGHWYEFVMTYKQFKKEILRKEKDFLKKTIGVEGGQNAAARVLDMPKSSLATRLKILGIK